MAETRKTPPIPPRAQDDPAAVRVALVLTAVAIMAFFVVVPLVNVFVQAFANGVHAYWDNLVHDADTLHSIKLTLMVAPVAVGLNLVFGIAAAWAIARFRFPGRTVLTALIDLPFSVSPVVAGLMFVLIFGLQGYLGPWLRADGYAVMPYLVSAVGTGLALSSFFMFLPVNPKARRGLWSHPWLTAIGGSAKFFAALLFIQQHFEVWPRNTSLKIIF